MTGLKLGASFSWNCNRANRLEITPMLREYAEKYIGDEQKIREALEKLVSCSMYKIIARANNISDPLDLRVVKAHWIGGPTLEKAGYIWHHNSYAKDRPNCQVYLKDGYFWHLGSPRIKAKPEDIKIWQEAEKKLQSLT
ncbi:MAG: DUF6390 family protein [bacterium]